MYPDYCNSITCKQLRPNPDHKRSPWNSYVNRNLVISIIKISVLVLFSFLLLYKHVFDYIQVASCLTQTTVSSSVSDSAVFSEHLSLIRSSFLGAEALRYEHTLWGGIKARMNYSISCAAAVSVCCLTRSLSFCSALICVAILLLNPARLRIFHIYCNRRVFVQIKNL